MLPRWVSRELRLWPQGDEARPLCHVLNFGLCGLEAFFQSHFSRFSSFKKGQVKTIDVPRQSVRGRQKCVFCLLERFVHMICRTMIFDQKCVPLQRVPWPQNSKTTIEYCRMFIVYSASSPNQLFLLKKKSQNIFNGE